MGIMDVLWIFIIISALQPALQRRYLDAMRTRKIAEIEKMRDSRVILLVHRQETMSLLGFPVMRFIDVNDSEEVLRAIQMTGDDVPLDIILHTPGGLVLASLQIARALQAHKGKVTVFVPHYAMSGGTLIALAAKEIVMCKHSVLCLPWSRSIFIGHAPARQHGLPVLPADDPVDAPQRQRGKGQRRDGGGIGLAQIEDDELAQQRQ
jgi:hypothetical protein